MAKKELTKKELEAKAAEKAAKKEAAKAARAARPRYPESIEARNAGDVNADNKLIRPPTAFDKKLHKAVKKSDYANESVFMEHRAASVEVRGHELIRKAQEMRAAAAEMARFGADPAKAAAAKKLAKLRAAAAELEALLAAEGIEVS